MNNATNQAETETAKAFRALLSIERISRISRKEIAVVDPLDLLKTINEIAIRTIKESDKNTK